MPDGISTASRSLAKALWAIVGECLYPWGSQLKVYCVPSQVKANWDLSSSLRGITKNMSLTSTAGIHGWAAACTAVTIDVMLGTAAVSGGVLLFDLL